MILNFLIFGFAVSCLMMTSASKAAPASPEEISENTASYLEAIYKRTGDDPYLIAKALEKNGFLCRAVNSKGIKTETITKIPKESGFECRLSYCGAFYWLVGDRAETQITFGLNTPPGIGFVRFPFGTDFYGLVITQPTKCLKTKTESLDLLWDDAVPPMLPSLEE